MSFMFSIITVAYLIFIGYNQEKSQNSYEDSYGIISNDRSILFKIATLFIIFLL